MRLHQDIEKTGASESPRRVPPVTLIGAAPVLCVSAAPLLHQTRRITHGKRDVRTTLHAPQGREAWAAAGRPLRSRASSPKPKTVSTSSIGEDRLRVLDRSAQDRLAAPTGRRVCSAAARRPRYGRVA